MTALVGGTVQRRLGRTGGRTRTTDFLLVRAKRSPRSRTGFFGMSHLVLMESGWLALYDAREKAQFTHVIGETNFLFCGFSYLDCFKWLVATPPPQRHSRTNASD